MESRKRGQAGIITALIVIILGSLVFVSALSNSTNDSFVIEFNESLNITLVAVISNGTVNGTSTTNIALPLNETINVALENQTTEDLALVNKSITINETINLTIPIEKLTLMNQSFNNETIINQTFPKKTVKNLTEIVESNKNKLNNETEAYFKNIKNKKEVREFIIKFKTSVDEAKLVNVTLDRKIDRFKLTKITGEIEDIEDLIEDSEIEFLELEQDIDILEEQIPFNVKKVMADSVWNLSNGSGIKVAVLDTGIGQHDDLSISSGYSVVSPNYDDNNGHGTKVAGVIAALRNNHGMVGISPAIDLYSVKIMETSIGELSDAISGVEWAIDNNMDIVSMSFGFNGYSQIFKEVLQEAYDNGILLVAASGNEGTDNILYPARYSSVIAVGATTANDELAYFSSYGFEQELVAPGVNINTTTLGNTYGTDSGTSLAAPHVAGVAALIKSFNKSLTNIEIRNKLRNDAKDLGQQGKDDLFGYGLVQINLETTNYTSVNLSYYYKIYNITKINLTTYDFESEFWIDGIGTIDSVDFNLGYYFVNITYNNNISKSRIYHIVENGSIFILAETIGYSENFSTEGGTTSDGVGWINEDLNVLRTDTGAPQVDVECFDLSSGPNLPYDYCYAINPAEMTDCDNDFTRINCGSGTTCDDTNKVGQGHPIISSSSVGSGQTIGEFFWGCGGGLGENTGTTNSPTWYVVSKKRARCTSTTAYVVEGWYGGSNWVTYDTDSCATGTTCVDTQNYTSKSAYINPCQVPQVDQVCSGTISSIVTDSKNNPLKGLKVYRNSVLNGTTDNDGSRSINFTNVVCGSSQSITIKCGDDTTCDTKSTSIDSEGDYDSLTFTCNICINKTDLSVKSSDVTTKSQGNKHNITALINVEKVTASNIKVDFRGQNLKSDVTQNETKTISVSQYANQNVSVSWDLNSTDFVSITVDFSNIIAETDESNNYVKKATRPLTKAYVNIDTDYSVLNSVYNNFLDDYIDLVSEANAEIKIYIGRKNSNIPKGEQTANNQRWELKDNLVRFNSKREGLPYNGIAIKKNNNIYVFGNEIDGEIAALRKLVDNREFYFSKSVNERIDYISEEDLDGLFVFDYMHTDEKQPDYRKNSANFAKGVENVLNSDVYSLAIKRVLTANDNTSLRIKHVNAELGPKYKNFTNPRPIVLARGLWSNLFSWENFGFEIARGQWQNRIRDTWLIEITGGPNTECSTCPSYNYSDLVDFYWPALVSGVEKYSGQNKIDYVGHSNACRTALDSLKNWSSGKPQAGYYHNGSDWVLTSLSSNVVENFVGVGCPGAFEGGSPFKNCFNRYGVCMNRTLRDKDHISLNDIRVSMLNCIGESGQTDRICTALATQGLVGNGTISYNLLNQYYYFINSTQDTQPGNINLSSFMVIQGHVTPVSPDSDMIVTHVDEEAIYRNVNSQFKSRANVYGVHTGTSLSLPDRELSRDIITRALNGIRLTFGQRIFNCLNFTTNSVCD